MAGGSRLKGRRIVVTRPRDRASTLVEALEAEGADVLLLPMLEVLGPVDPGPLEAAIMALSDFDWLAFTSAYGVRALGERPPAGGHPRVACVGEATAEEARERGWVVDLVADPATGEALARAMIRAGAGPGSRILFPKAEDALEGLPTALRAAGAAVTEVVAYRKAAPDAAEGRSPEPEQATRIDAVTFTSPSIVREFMERYPRVARECAVVVIGPTTAEAARRAGLTVAAVADEPSVEGLTRAVVEAFG